MAESVSPEMIRNRLKESLSNKMNALPPSWKSFSSIYRVPSKLRRVNEEAYTPRLVSIGPLHYGSAHLQAMEPYKLRCLQSYLKRCSSHKEIRFDLKSAVDWAESEETSVRLCYHDTIKLSREEFSEMMLLDGVFIVELLLKNSVLEERGVRDEVDLIIQTNWMLGDLVHDMLLLENQLPFLVPFGLFDNIKASLPPDTNILNLTHKFLKNVGNTHVIHPPRNIEPLHLLDYLLYIHLGTLGPYQSENRGKLEYTYRATVLHQAGVKFMTETTRSRLLEIVFEGGVLKIPKITVNEWTETFFRNLIAYEQCHHRPGYVCSYVIFMDCLIDTPKDVDLLVECGIIQNSLDNSKLVSDLFNNLYKEVITEHTYFHFYKISKDLNDYSKDYWHQWKAQWYKWKLILTRDYFSSPWAIISVIAAIILLGLTTVQTVCSVLGL